VTRRAEPQGLATCVALLAGLSAISVLVAPSRTLPKEWKPLSLTLQGAPDGAVHIRLQNPNASSLGMPNLVLYLTKPGDRDGPHHSAVIPVDHGLAAGEAFMVSVRPSELLWWSGPSHDHSPEREPFEKVVHPGVYTVTAGASVGKVDRYSSNPVQYHVPASPRPD
jgi:hypothetical protein